eukprot:882349-Prorocentrum_minimum.AAC.2
MIKVTRHAGKVPSGIAVEYSPTLGSVDTRRPHRPDEGALVTKSAVQGDRKRQDEAEGGRAHRPHQPDEGAEVRHEKGAAGGAQHQRHPEGDPHRAAVPAPRHTPLSRSANSQ